MVRGAMVYVQFARTAFAKLILYPTKATAQCLRKCIFLYTLLHLKWIGIVVYRTSVHRALSSMQFEHLLAFDGHCNICNASEKKNERARCKIEESYFALNIFRWVFRCSCCSCCCCFCYVHILHCHLWFLLHCWRRNYYVIDFAWDAHHHITSDTFSSI